jgi:S-formylglutathione hydrolase FrmB
MRWMVGVAGALVGAGFALAAWGGPAGHPILQVTVGPGLSAPKGGRLLIFAEPIATAEAAAKDGQLPPIDASPFEGAGSAVAAAEIARATPGETLDIDLDGIAFPQGFSRLPPGEYAVQAVLDVGRNYNYAGRGPGDLVSPVVRLRLPLDGPPPLSLDTVLPDHDPWTPRPGANRETIDHLAALHGHAEPIAFVSPALSAFWGRPVTMRGWVVTPPGYDPRGKATYPTVFYTSGFGGTAARLLTGPAATIYAAMASGRTPSMIWVLLDQSGATGTNEFADSVNNGPWGRALTEELIPSLERNYRMDARAKGRFLNGHSSGGWATLWLQTRYPKIFGGTWSTSPDPSDFHDFTGIDIYAPGANVYRAPDGSKRPLVREGGKVVGAFEQFTALEEVLGPYGGQERSFDWVFSPRGPDGRPEPMFDRVTGDVDRAVAAYWRDHYDIAHRIAANWPALKPDLDGKIHIAVGTADTFYLDGAAHRLQAVLDGLGAKSRFQFIPGRTHFDLYKIGDNPTGLLDTFTWEMYAIARPGSHPPATAASPVSP